MNPLVMIDMKSKLKDTIENKNEYKAISNDLTENEMRLIKDIIHGAKGTEKVVHKRVLTFDEAVSNLKNHR
jgi:hypothetical protein